MTHSLIRRNRTLVILFGITALCYLIGYPLALVWNSNIGWIFVGLGGPMLIASGVVLIRCVQSGEFARQSPPP